MVLGIVQVGTETVHCKSELKTTAHRETKYSRVGDVSQARAYMGVSVWLGVKVIKW